MDTIELIKKFEDAGFSRVQAEVQVKTMADIKKGLMTQSDGEAIHKDLSAKIDLLNDKVDSRFQNVEMAFKAINDRFSALDTKISLSPVINTIYMLGLLVMYLGFTRFGPLIQEWLLKL